MKILRSILLGSAAVWAGQAFAADDAQTEIHALQARLKQLEQRIDDQGRKARAQAKIATKAPSPFDPCPVGKVCYKGVTLTFGGWVDFAGINNTGCNIENSPAATCNGNTSEVRQYTAGFYDTVLKGDYGAVKFGVQYSYNQRLAFAGVDGAPKTDDHIVMT